MKYKADITAGALKVPESRAIADLLLRDVSDKEWRSALYEENVLQTRSPKTAKRLSVLIRGRLASVETPSLRESTTSNAFRSPAPQNSICVSSAHKTVGRRGVIGVP